MANSVESDTGFVGERLQGHGFSLEIALREDLNSSFSPGQADLLLLLGSSWSVYWPEVADVVQTEAALLRKWVLSGAPVMAICFGAQLAALALGATVNRSPQPEIGWTMIDSNISGIANGPWMQWHSDVFTVPSSATALAHNQVGPQAFRQQRLLAVQFHPEATVEMVTKWSSGEGQSELSRVGIDRDFLIAQSHQQVERSEGDAHCLVDWFLDQVVGAEGL